MICNIILKGVPKHRNLPMLVLMHDLTLDLMLDLTLDLKHVYDPAVEQN